MLLSKKIVFIFLLVAFIGFVDASFLTSKAFSGEIPPCFITTGCESVTTSAYSRILGVPVALLGAIFYLTSLLLMMYYVDKQKSEMLAYLGMLGTIGFAFSLWFLYVQTFILKTYCSFCLVSTLTSTILFVIGIYAWLKIRKEKEKI